MILRACLRLLNFVKMLSIIDCICVNARVQCEFGEVDSKTLVFYFHCCFNYHLIQFLLPLHDQLRNCGTRLRQSQFKQKNCFIQNTILRGSTLHLHKTVLHMTRVLASTFIFDTSNFGTVAGELLVFVEIGFLFELILFFYQLVNFLVFAILFIYFSFQFPF